MTNYAAATLRFARMPTHVLADMDVASPFMTWLNGVSGTWAPDPDNAKKQRWKLSGTPWIMPDGHPFLHIIGRMPKYNLQSDGVVMIGNEYFSWTKSPTAVGGVNTQRIHVRLEKGIDEPSPQAAAPAGDEGDARRRFAHWVPLTVLPPRVSSS